MEIYPPLSDTRACGKICMKECGQLRRELSARRIEDIAVQSES